jgi:hypothetical protein
MDGLYINLDIFVSGAAEGSKVVENKKPCSIVTEHSFVYKCGHIYTCPHLNNRIVDSTQKFNKMLFTRLLIFLPIISLALVDGASIAAAMQKITADSTALNETVASFNGNLLTVLDILGKSTELLLAINDGTRTAQSSANLTDLDVLGIVGPTQTLVTTVNQTLTTIINKKPIFEKELLSLAILLNLKTEKAASDKFSDAVVEKVPTALQDTARTLVAPIDDAFEEAIAEYSSFL